MSEANALENWYLTQEEPVRSCLLALRKLILDMDALGCGCVEVGRPVLLLSGACVLLSMDR